MALNPQISSRSQAVVQYPLKLGSHTGIKTYNRAYPRLEAALYLAQIIVRVQGSASQSFEREITQVNEAIDQELKRLQQHITSCLNQARKLLAQQGGSVDVIYTVPVEIKATSRTPKGRLCAQTLMRLEEAVQQFEQAWHLGLMSDQEHLKVKHAMWRSFNRACTAIERLARGLSRRVQTNDLRVGLNGVYPNMVKKRTGRMLATEIPTDAHANDDHEHMNAAETQALNDTEALVVQAEQNASEADQHVSTPVASDSSSTVATLEQERPTTPRPRLRAP